MADFWAGIAPEHRIPLAAMLVAPLLVRQLRRIAPWRTDDPAARWVAHLLAPVVLFHALVGPVDLVGAVAAGWVGARIVRGRRWRGPAVVVMLALVGVNVVADQARMAAALLELAVLALAAPRVVTVLVTVVFGTAAWGVGLARHQHDGVDRLQAGFIRRGVAPGGGTVDGTALAARTVAATERYRDPAAAVADGFRATGRPEGLQVHYESRANQDDGRTLDPQAPEQLVYAVRGGKALLLGVVYQLPVAGARGPAIDAAGASWHAHDVCVGLLPPGFGVVSPYGGCPGTMLSVTFAEMIHVWVVDPPGGAYAEDLDEAWVVGKLNAA
jgi:hypothetical protein